MDYEKFIKIRIKLAKEYHNLKLNTDQIKHDYLKELINNYVLIDNDSFFIDHDRDSLGFYQLNEPHKRCYILIDNINNNQLTLNNELVYFNNFDDLLIKIAKYVLANAK